MQCRTIVLSLSRRDALELGPGADAAGHAERGNHEPALGNRIQRDVGCRSWIHVTARTVVGGPAADLPTRVQLPTLLPTAFA
jgi:hypothetical protein